MNRSGSIAHTLFLSLAVTALFPATYIQASNDYTRHDKVAWYEKPVVQCVVFAAVVTTVYAGAVMGGVAYSPSELWELMRQKCVPVEYYEKMEKILTTQIKVLTEQIRDLTDHKDTLIKKLAKKKTLLATCQDALQAAQEKIAELLQQGEITENIEEAVKKIKHELTLNPDGCLVGINSNGEFVPSSEIAFKKTVQGLTVIVGKLGDGINFVIQKAKGE
jgi:exonuclease VII small subunit